MYITGENFAPGGVDFLLYTTGEDFAPGGVDFLLYTNGGDFVSGGVDLLIYTTRWEFEFCSVDVASTLPFSGPVQLSTKMQGNKYGMQIREVKVQQSFLFSTTGY